MVTLSLQAEAFGVGDMAIRSAVLLVGAAIPAWIVPTAG
jgi:hypothetical protein